MMNYVRTVVRFISSYHTFDYGVTLAGTSEERRVIVERDGTVKPPHYGTTPETRAALAAAVIEYKRAEYADAVKFAAERGISEYLPAPTEYRFATA